MAKRLTKKKRTAIVPRVVFGTVFAGVVPATLQACNHGETAWRPATPAFIPEASAPSPPEASDASAASDATNDD
jgi:hypothetical protein